jgi:sec-independent protein translocase protein TatB
VLNIGGPELLVIMFIALLVLGPTRLPDAVRQVGKFMGEIRKLSSGFQTEVRSALREAEEEAERESAHGKGRPGGNGVAPDRGPAPRDPVVRDDPPGPPAANDLAE